MARLWIDATTFLKWISTPVGISRVESELISYAANNLKNAHFFKYIPESNTFQEVDRETIRSKNIKKPSTVDNPTTAISKRFIQPKINDFKYFAKLSLKSFYQMLLSLINVTYHSRINSYSKRMLVLIRKVLNKFSKPKQPVFSQSQNSIVHPFIEKDVILCAGGTWEYLEFFHDITSLKNKFELFLYCFCYDIIPLKFPHLSFFEHIDKTFFPYFKLMSQTADHVFCISKNTAEDFIEFINQQNLSTPKTSIVTLGNDISYGCTPTISSRLQKLFQQEFVLYVSTIERRKNHECIYKAILYLLENTNVTLPKFVFVGRLGWTIGDFLSDLSYDPRIKDSIIILHEISDTELDWLYRSMLFSVYPSFYEGWGLPIAESLSYGKMAIVSSTSSMSEVGGELLDYVHPFDIIGWANRMAYYLNNRDQLLLREKNILEKYKKRTWDDFNKQVLCESHLSSVWS